MSETGIKGIVLDKISLNVANIAFLRKLEEFDCAVVMDEQGNDKQGKAELAVSRALLDSSNPSVLLITTEKLMYAWYQALLLGIGADFKFITSNQNSINYFSPKISNLYITSENSGSNPIFAKIKQAGLVWDLVVIDGGLSKGGFDSEHVLNSFDIKTKKLVVFSSYLKPDANAAKRISKLPEKFLENRDKAKYFENHFAQENVAEFTLSSPFICSYPKESLAAPAVKTIEYEYNKEILDAKEEQTTTPAYTYGGNIFEELTLDMRKLYNLDRYDDQTTTALREFDGKLNAFLNEISSILEDPDARVITYFSSDRTLEYVYKILCSAVVGLKSVTAVKKSAFYRISETIEGFETGDNNDIRIVLSLDDQNEQCSLLSTITHVINYELPNSTLTLHRRFRQGGRNGFANPEFILFSDRREQFDGRMLKKVLALNFSNSFRSVVPERNIYLFVNGAEEIFAELVCRLDNVEKLNQNDIAQLSAEFNIKEHPDKAMGTICKLRDAIKTAFDLPNDRPNRAEITDALKKRIGELRKGCCRYDSDGVLVVKEYDVEGSEDYKKIEKSLNSEPLIKEQSEARKALDKCSKDKNYFGVLAEAQEKDKAIIYYCAWRYLAENCGLGKNYNEFLREIFEEVI